MELLMDPDISDEANFLSSPIPVGESECEHKLDETGYLSSNFGDDESDDENDGHGADKVFDKIRSSIISGASEKGLVRGGGSVASLDRLYNQDSSSSASNHCSLTYGFIPKGCYNHPIKSGEILGICHNPRYRQFLMLDAKGITSWKYDSRTGPPVVRQLNYPSYQYRLYSNLVYDKKHNVYFCLGKDFSLKILNHQFQETYTVEANLRNVMFLLYNPQREELITGGVGGSKVWQFVQVVEDKGWTEVKAMSNYKLQHRYTLRNVGGGWVKKVAMDEKLGHLYCCSETDLHAYNLNNGDEIFSLKRAHDMSITGCVYSKSAQFIVTSSNDCSVKCWIVNGGLVHTFKCHTKSVTQIMGHPEAPSLVLTCSADCSIKLLSLDTLNVLFSITVSSEGVQWMGLTHENMLWACTSRQITMWNLNHFVEFFSLSRASVHKLSLQSAPKKSTRLLAVGDDSCIRLFSSHQRRHMCSVLPMPCLSALEKVRCVAYSRELNLVYCLLNRSKLWIYTTRTDPACRIAQWDFGKIQDMLIKKEEVEQTQGSKKEALLKKISPYRTVGDIHANVEICECTTIATLNSHILLWGDEGWVGTVPTKFLLVGLSDGRVLFMDPFVRGLLHVDFRANKDTIREIRHEKKTQQLLTQCDRNEVALIQIWALPTLQLQHELCLYQEITCSTRLADTVFYGYTDGSVSFHKLEEVDEDNINRRTNQIKNKEELRLSGMVQKKVEHKGSILNIDCCPRKRLFLTCSLDTMIKIWSTKDRCVIADITLNSTLSCASFLNSTADIVFGFSNNLYCVDFNTLCPDFVAPPTKETYAESITAESEIYEDPATTSETVIPNIDPLDLNNYLKPYELDITKDFLEATDIVVRPQTREKEEESEVMSNAPTDIYGSECSTPRLSRMDVFTPQPVQWDQLSSHSGKAPRPDSSGSQKSSKSEKQHLFDRLDVTNPEHAEYYLPMFGDSPGGTPSVSSAASIADSRSDLDDMSDYEFGTEYGSDDQEFDEERTEHKPAVTKASKPLPQFSSKKKKKAKADLVLTLAPDDPSSSPQQKSVANKYGIDKMKIDVGALMKQGQKKSKKVTVSEVRPVEHESMEDQLANLALKQSLQAGASELSSKKKKAAGSRKRAPVAKKQPASSKKQLVEPVQEKEPAVKTVAPEVIKKEKVKTISGTLASGLVPAPAQVQPQKKEQVKRRGQLIEAKSTPVYPAQMVKIALDDNDLNPDQLEDHEDDVDLSTYMDIDDMECKSAASWNPKFDFEPGGSAKLSPDLSKLYSTSPQGPLTSSAQDDIARDQFSELGSPDSRLRVSVSRRTTAMSGGMSDLDAMSIQMDAYDDIVEGRLTPQTSASEYAADESTTRSGASPMRLPNLLPDLEEDSNLPTHSDALSRWLMGSVPRPGSVADSEAPTRPGRKAKVVHVAIDDGSQDGTEARPNSSVADLTLSKMLGFRNRRPHTAPIGASCDDLQDAFDEALLKFQGDTDINKLFRNNVDAYDDNWQDKHIERHKLLSMQKEIRAKSAVHRRQLIHQQLMDKRHSLLGHRHCDGVIDATEDQSTPPPSTRGSDSRIRMNSATSKPLISVSLNDARLRKSKTSELREASSPLMEKANLINETHVQYRFRINEALCQDVHNTLKASTPLPQDREPDSVSYDPRRPESVRRPGTRSIPSRCTRFVLVKQKRTNDRPSSPTPLEKQLLCKRFPSYANRVIPQYVSSQMEVAKQHQKMIEEKKLPIATHGS